jgi:hypothetical protein
MGRCSIFWWLACGWLAACGGGGGGDGEDWPYPLWVPTDVAVVDVDGDGRNDVLTLAQFAGASSQQEGRLTVHLQSAPGSFVGSQAVSFGTYPWRFAVADIDGDGAVDVVATDVDADGVWLLLQDRAKPGQFRAATLLATGLDAYGVTIADLDGDGLPDIAVTDSKTGSARLVLLYQDATRRGAFRPARNLAVPGTATTAVASGDLDGDGRADLAIGVALPRSDHTPRPAIGVSLQQADGTLGAVALHAQYEGLNFGRLAVQDYDGDGRSDVLAYLTPFSSPYTATLLVMLQSPAGGTFASPALTRVDVRGLDDAVFADLDGDDHPDAALCGFFPVGSPSTVEARLHRYTQSGAGRFALVSSATLPIAASRLTAGDLDADGRNEIVVLADGDRYLVFE